MTILDMEGYNKTAQNLDKGQIKPKADWCAIDSPKKRTKELGFFFAMRVPKCLKHEVLISSFKYFWTVKQKNKTN